MTAFGNCVTSQNLNAKGRWSDFSRPFARLLALAAVVSLATLTAARADVKTGDLFPDFAAASIAPLGSTALPSATGQVMLVDFWASWCAPCKASFPAMAKLYSDYAPRGLVIAAVSIDEKPAAAAGFIKKLAPPFPTYHDREQKLVKQVVVPTMPTSYLIGRDGKVRFMHEGFHGDATDAQLRKEIDSLLAEK